MPSIKNQLMKIVTQESLNNIALNENTSAVRLIAEEQAVFYGKQMLSILDNLIKKANATIKSGSNPIPSPAMQSPMLVQSDDLAAFKVDINFPPVRRASYYPEGYPEGVYDLIGLLDQGFPKGKAQTRNYAYKVVEINEGGATVMIRGLRHRHGLHFIDLAVNMFNAIAPSGVKAFATRTGLSSTL